MRWAIASGFLVLTSALAAWVQAAVSFLDSPWRQVAVYVDYPGTAIWWLTFGGPFQDAPRSVTGATVVTVANAAFWLGVAKVAALASAYVVGKAREP
jgi:hypothetical protein